MMYRSHIGRQHAPHKASSTADINVFLVDVVRVVAVDGGVNDAGSLTDDADDDVWL